MTLGRPSEYSQDFSDKICEEIANGRSLRSICEKSDMPSKAAVFRWLAAREEFRDQYARAREAQADALSDEILDIADDRFNDTYVDEDGRERTNSDVIARSRLRVDARKWIAAKLKPKVYGEKLAAELSGVNGKPIEHQHQIIERIIVDPTDVSGR